MREVMIRGVTVDWWHTLAEPHEGWEPFAKRVRIEGVQDVLRRHGIECTLARLDIAYDLWTEHLERAWRRAEDWSGERQIADLLASAGYDGSASPDLLAELREPIGRPLVEHPPRIHQGAVETLRTLRESGHKLAIISNTGRTWGTFLRQVQEKVGLGDLFDHRTFSDEERVRKPASAIFERTLSALGLRPHEVAHVGDDVSADVAGAKSVGMRAVLYAPEPKTTPVEVQADAIIRAWRELPDILRRW